MNEFEKLYEQVVNKTRSPLREADLSFPIGSVVQIAGQDDFDEGLVVGVDGDNIDVIAMGDGFTVNRSDVASRLIKINSVVHVTGQDFDEALVIAVDGDDIDVIELGDGYTIDRNDLNTYPPSQTRPRKRPEGIKMENIDDDLRSLQAQHDNPDVEFAKKNYGSVEAYQDMLKKKIRKLEVEISKRRYDLQRDREQYGGFGTYH
tara:strand:+ start:160 stop:771 length:612 start_codon:yes stop_codon:yes gene_type:complete